MKYLIPEFLFISLAFLFTESYIRLCVLLFETLGDVSSVSFSHNAFLAFPLTNVLVFCLLGMLRHRLAPRSDQQPLSVIAFVKENFLYLVVAAVFVLRIVEALNEEEAISPYWPAQLSKWSLLIDLLSTFCVAAVLLHLYIQLSKIFQNRSH
jgi:hypothetical protein